MARVRAKEHMNNQIYSTVRDDIIDGFYPGGTFLVEADLCERFNVSRTPVREALIRLENDGFLEQIPNRGAYVPHITLQDIIDIYQLRAANDSMAVMLCVRQQDPNLLMQLKASVAREEFLFSQDPIDIRAISNEDYVFHTLISESCSNKRMVAVLRNISNMMKRIVHLSADKYAHKPLADSLAFHKRIVDAFEKNDPLEARDVMTAHWMAMIEGYIHRDLPPLL